MQIHDLLPPDQTTPPIAILPRSEPPLKMPPRSFNLSIPELNPGDPPLEGMNAFPYGSTAAAQFERIREAVLKRIIEQHLTPEEFGRRLCLAEGKPAPIAKMAMRKFNYLVWEMKNPRVSDLWAICVAVGCTSLEELLKEA